MSQTRRGSLTEATTNIVVGFLISWGMWIIVLPLFGISESATTGFWITMLFTVTSFVRSYVLRRMFNRYIRWRAAHVQNT